MFNPISTYRIQFNKAFTFADFLENLEYFEMLGVSSIYSSPVFAAVPGSAHGYDVTDPLRLNPEIGNSDELKKIHNWKSERNIGWLQDIVPNHMAFHIDNKWLMDVLENGEDSAFSGFFDIDFNHPGSDGKVMIPILGKQPDEAIRDREITIVWNNGNFHVKYFDFQIPSSHSASSFLVKNTGEIVLKSVYAKNGNDHAAEWERIKSESETRYNEDNEFKHSINTLLDFVNSDAQTLSVFLQHQNFKLVHWTDSSRRLNYRRFFTINSLICLAMENDRTFNEYHRYIGELVKERIFTGLRIDHIDGLKMPLYYLEKLKHISEGAYIISEKILGLKESMPYGLLANGTSGYDYLGIVNNLFTYKDNYDLLKRFYSDLTGTRDSIEDIIYNKKRLILTGSMNGEWDNLTRLFEQSGYVAPGLSADSVRNAIGEMLVCFPVYKIYPEYNSLSETEEAFVEAAHRQASLKNPSLIPSLDLVRDILINEKYWNKNSAINFTLRFLQFTGPLMAKGIEDTVMYSYNCFIAHNEVGDHPGSGGFSVREYHDLMIKRQRIMPLSLNATSTHDTKRGEDARARLNVLSEMADDWISYVRKWIEMNNRYRVSVKGKTAPDRNEEYFIYQTIAGVFPHDMHTDERFRERVDEYIVKSLREAKINSDWNSPDEEYEKAVKDFTGAIMEKNTEFMKSFIPFQRIITQYGIINSFSQLVLKATSPGVPDFYQGTELWDLSMVDPDNRRPVDYSLRTSLLSDLNSKNPESSAALFKDLAKDLTDGRMKLWLTHILMNIRKAEPDLFANGTYLPLDVTGKKKGNVIAFARFLGNKWLIVVVPLYISVLTSGKKITSEISWRDTAVTLPDFLKLELKEIMTGYRINPEGNILLSGIMKTPFPVILKGIRRKPDRSAGVLLHISSLPGNYGTGDLGYEALEFADILNRNGQEYWQILPFNPVDEGYAYSPYSSSSAFAGNILFISPDMLVRSGLISRKTAESLKAGESAKTDFRNALRIRNSLIDEAFDNFFGNKRPYQHSLYRTFCENESFWLDDFALFNILKNEFRQKPWNEWPARFKDRDESALSEFRNDHENELEKQKFSQFLFQEQWKYFKDYCNRLNIKIIGDMSFYVNYDSADVWSNPDYFKLDKKKVPQKVSGVPPDYFSDTGQLWNMPVYDWEKLKADDYKWWLERIKRNIELCDLLRFDHFRGFSEYWEVTYGEKTAINGKWITGPGEDFFNKIKDVYPEMPFIAEDLGTIDDKVRQLRDSFRLPGMSVIQFAFGDNTACSEYIPHNIGINNIVYTGTHDNNTVKGWFTGELDERGRKEAGEYAGHQVKKDSCHIDFIRMAYSSVAKIAIIPAQDIMGLGADTRLNKPSTSGNNWQWKMKKADLKEFIKPDIRRLAALYGRI